MSTKSPVATRADYAWLAAIIALLAVVHFIVGRLPCVGDETRYAFQGVGLYSSGSFYPQATLWRPFAAASGCGNGGVLSQPTAPGRPLQTISTSVLYGAALRTVGIEGARWLNFIVGCVGLSLLYFLLMRRFRASGGASWAARIAVASLALTLPFVPYLQLIYPETLLFTAVSGALYALLRRFRYAGLAAVIALPFLHERALPLAMGFFVVLLLQMAHDRAPIAFIARVCALFAAGMALLAATQLWALRIAFRLRISSLLALDLHRVRAHRNATLRCSPRRDSLHTAPHRCRRRIAARCVTARSCMFGRTRALCNLLRDVHVVDRAGIVDRALLGRRAAVSRDWALLLALQCQALVGMATGPPTPSS